jgi:hypothetical protein
VSTAKSKKASAQSPVELAVELLQQAIEAVKAGELLDAKANAKAAVREMNRQWYQEHPRQWQPREKAAELRTAIAPPDAEPVG